MQHLSDGNACENVRPELMSFLLGEVSAEESAAVRQHLRNCRRCAEEAHELRATVGLVEQGGTMEPVPRHFRLVAEPAGVASSFWRNSSRLAFAASLLLCLSVTLLTALRATVSYRQGGFEIAFGAPSSAVAVHDGEAQAGVRPVSASPALSRPEVVRLIAEAVTASEARQHEAAVRMVNAVAARAAAQRQADWRDMAESLRSFQAAQVSMWKEQVQSQQYVSALMRNAGLELPPSQ